jgi:hypothetical protein
MLNAKPLAFSKMELELTDDHKIEISDLRTQKNNFTNKIVKFSEGIKKCEPKRLGQVLSYVPLF